MAIVPKNDEEDREEHHQLHQLHSEPAARKSDTTVLRISLINRLLSTRKGIILCVTLVTLIAFEVLYIVTSTIAYKKRKNVSLLDALLLHGIPASANRTRVLLKVVGDFLMNTSAVKENHGAD